VARVVDAAVPASQPFKPQKGQLVVVAFVLGLFLGAIASLLLDRLDNTLKGGEDAEFKLKLPLLAATPVLETHERPATMKMFLEHGESMYSESIRTARTSVLLSNIDEPRKIILVTSALPAEGKSSVASNLALAHAHTKPTLLIDADMRRPQVARSFDLPPGAKGLSNLVSGNSDRADCIHSVPHSALKVMPCGDIPPNPTELLLSQRFKETLASLAGEFEMIIIDSPPVELVSDALVIAPQATSTVFVVLANQTAYQLARKGIIRLQRVGANILGVVLNGVDFKKNQKYHGEYTAYGTYGKQYAGYYGGKEGSGSAK